MSIFTDQATAPKCGDLCDDAVHPFVCLSVRSLICRLWNMLSRSLGGSTWRQAGFIVSSPSGTFALYKLSTIDRHKQTARKTSGLRIKGLRSVTNMKSWLFRQKLPDMLVMVLRGDNGPRGYSDCVEKRRQRRRRDIRRMESHSGSPVYPARVAVTQRLHHRASFPRHPSRQREKNDRSASISSSSSSRPDRAIRRHSARAISNTLHHSNGTGGHQTAANAD